MYFDKITGKPMDALSKALPGSLDEECEHCGYHSLITRCIQCEAPICCPKCCDESSSLIPQADGV